MSKFYATPPVYLAVKVFGVWTKIAELSIIDTPANRRTLSFNMKLHLTTAQRASAEVCRVPAGVIETLIVRNPPSSVKEKSTK